MIMGFREAVSHVFHNYANFNGRARRSEYWYFYLFNWLLGVAVTVLMYVCGGIGLVGLGNDSAAAAGGALTAAAIVQLLYFLYVLAAIIPNIAVSCRRLHDIGRSGAYLLIGFVPVVGWIFLLIWSLQDGDPGDNRYGESPKAAARVRQAPRPAYAQADSRQAPRPAYAQADSRQAPPQPGRVQVGSRFVPDEGGSRADGGYPATEPQGRSLYLQCLAGAYRGRRAPVLGRILVGRGPDCDLRFPPETRGVSRRHCVIASVNGQLLVQDLNSSCGTYINGRPLAPGRQARLKPGDRLFLGSAEQVFTVTA